MAGEWWRDAVVYTIYVRSFADSNGDGIGDLAGIRERLPYLADLGVDAIWLTPFYRSPMRDHGYDVSNHRTVDPMFGTLADVDTLLATAHSLGLRVYVDIVPNHTSDEHPWFQAAIRDTSAPERDRYMFRPGHPDGGPPNDWESVFGGSAWAPDPTPGSDGYYLHLFDASQPDLDWRNPLVHAEFLAVLRYWFDRGVDGFRIDVAHGLYKDAQLRDGKVNAWDQDEVLGVWQEWRRVADAYADRAFIGEVFLYDMDRVAQYVGSRRLHQAFNFVIAKMPFDAGTIRQTLRRAVQLFHRADTAPTWVLSNHDLVRHVTRFGGGDVGRRRGLALTALLLALPGAAHVYQGEELGLEHSDIPPERRQDPMWVRSGMVGRDGARTPMPWTIAGPGHGFTTGEPWLPFDEQAEQRNAEVQAADPDSVLSSYKRMLVTRRLVRRQVAGPPDWPDSPDELVVVVQPLADGRRFLVVCNTSDAPVAMPLTGPAELMLATDSGIAVAGQQLQLPGASTAWVSVT